jgi:Glycine zipper 2TM domain
VGGTQLASYLVGSIVTGEGIHMSRITQATAAFLVASFVGLQPVPVRANDNQRRYGYDDPFDRRDEQRDRREERRDPREERRDHRDGYWGAGYGAWNPTPYYRRDDRRYRPRRMGRNDYIYRGSDDRYYCRRDDGTAGLIIGGIAGGVLGNIIARERSKTIGTIIGASAGAMIGKSIDDGNIVCR